MDLHDEPLHQINGLVSWTPTEASENQLLSATRTCGSPYVCWTRPELPLGPASPSAQTVPVLGPPSKSLAQTPERRICGALDPEPLLCTELWDDTTVRGLQRLGGNLRFHRWASANQPTTASMAFWQSSRWWAWPGHGEAPPNESRA